MKTALVATFALTLAVSPAHAQTLRAVRPIEGYGCAKLNATDKQMMDPKGTGIVIREAPAASAPVGTTAASILLVRTPAHVVGGFAEVMQFTGKPGWIETRYLKPIDPTVRCVPSIMSDGRPGIG